MFIKVTEADVSFARNGGRILEPVAEIFINVANIAWYTDNKIRMLTEKDYMDVVESAKEIEHMISKTEVEA